ncbi:MAG: S-layer homology domain-containing protein, partial [Clostridia bacterium]|nr:S-layer homology domain-containing protein [Clostridia bacterium]
SYVNGVELNSNNRMYTWEIEGNIGSVTPDGIFTLANTVNEEGSIKITTGEYEKVIPVRIADYPKTPNPFSDTVGHWAETIISEMSAKGVINGLEEEGHMVFKPDNNITRAEFASMIVNYKGLDLSQYEDVGLDFADNAEIPLWAEKVIKAAYSEGLILGRVHDDGSVTFAPYDNITRAEAMTIIGRILPENTDLPELPFTDMAEIPLWAQDGIKKLYSMGIANGYEDGTILPNNNMKRAEAAAMLYKIEN